MAPSCLSGQCPVPKAKQITGNQITLALFNEIVGALAAEPYELERACTQRGLAYPDLVTWINNHADAKALAARLYNGLADYHERRVYDLDDEAIYRVKAKMVRRQAEAMTELEALRREQRLMHEYRERAWLREGSALSFIDYSAQRSRHPRHGEQTGRAPLYLKHLNDGADHYQARYLAGLPVTGDPDLSFTALSIKAKHRAQPPLLALPPLWPHPQSDAAAPLHNQTRESELDRLRDMESLVRHEGQRLRAKYGDYFRHAA